METYNPEIARKIYRRLHESPDLDFPITALVVDGILQNFVYGTHTKYPSKDGETVHLTVSGKILSLPGWSDGIRSGVQNIIDTENRSKIAA